MADYFIEMGWRELGEGEQPDHLLHLARLFRDYNMFQELNTLNGEKLPPPASKAAVEALKDELISHEGTQCPVCLKEYNNGETVKKMPCEHKFHPECILPWLSKTNSCPLCRHELPTDDEDYEAWRQEKKRAKEREQDIENLHNSMFS
ncbi:E3 ubiquitin-protein ligase RNF181 [Sitophilus oryzae]|uniref:E3 ubiquitin-protein ligase RNF181 n=1 Tax=Sitophilus oryzae TaxID=7048 RepID=A0A6J2Y639_SITOR|nr:E3 ubiquitin-protein ligase RNF181 [Sitophilus oryzae]